MKLYLKKRGCDFSKSDEISTLSDLENHRLFLEFIDKHGKRICGDVGSGDRRKGAGNVVYYGIHADLQYESHNGTFCYPLEIPFGLCYNKADVLQVINTVSAVPYDDVEIVNELPPAAHTYPESALALERKYLATDHAALVKSLEDAIDEDFTFFYRCLKGRFQKLSPDEYKRLTLKAFQRLVDERGIIEDALPGLKKGHYVASCMVKRFFEEQSVVDPYADEAFLQQLAELVPLYVGDYWPTVTPEEFALSVD